MKTVESYETKEAVLVHQIAELLDEYFENYLDERPDNKVYLAIRKARNWFVKLDCMYNRKLPH